MEFKCLPLAIGSFPQKDAKRPLELIEENFPHIPLWPQLPQRSFKEQMYLQYSEGLPGLVVDEKGEKIFVKVDEDFFEKTALFYQNVLEGNLQHFAISPDFAEGLYKFIELKNKWKDAKFIKGQVTGPVSFALTITDQDKKPLIYNAEAFEAVKQTIIMKLKWQAETLRKINQNIIMFIDEPYLASLDSGILNLDKKKIEEVLLELIAAGKKANVKVGIHCCGNTDWDFILKLNPDILSFDTYNHIDNVIIYADTIKEFIAGGGSLALGIVPTDKGKRDETSDSLLVFFENILNGFQNKGVGKEIILRSSLITPSCGMGSLTEDFSEEICKKTFKLSELIRKKYDL